MLKDFFVDSFFKLKFIYNTTKVLFINILNKKK